MITRIIAITAMLSKRGKRELYRSLKVVPRDKRLREKDSRCLMSAPACPLVILMRPSSPKKGDHLATRDQLPGKGATAKKGFDFVVKTGELWCSLQSSICAGDDSGGKMSRTKK